MDPTIAEIEYANDQIKEANRRLDSIHNRVGSEYMRLTGKKDGDEYEHSEMKIKGRFPEGDGFPEKIKDEYENIEKSIEVDKELIKSHIQNVVIDCQLCIEPSAKSMFKLTGKDHPFSHGISFGNGKTQGFYSVIPDEFERKEDVTRVIFLTQFWGEFYELAKYGAPQLNVRPETIFTTDDASRAVNDAEYCIEVAEDLVEYVKTD